MSRAMQRWVLLVVVSAGILYYLLVANKQETSILSGFLPTNINNHHINWAKIKQKYPVKEFSKLPKESPKRLPKIQAPSGPESLEETATRLKRQQAVKDVFLQSWNAYKLHAWGHDEFSPLTKAFKDHFGGWGVTMVDTLDTLLIMELDAEFEHALKAVEAIDFSTTHVQTVNVFETTIRFLGGLLGANDLANGKDRGVLLKKAKELSEFLYHAFDTTNRMPVTRWTWKYNLAGVPEQPHSYVIAAEFGSMALEFTRLSQLTGDPRFYDAVKRVNDVLDREQSKTNIPGLWPVVFDAQQESFKQDFLFTLGGRADSLYEYVPKEYILLGGQSEQHRKMYTTYLDAAKKHLFFKPMMPDNLDLLIAGSAEAQFDSQIKLKPEGQHLSCFVGGLVALSSKIFDLPDDMSIANKLVNGCSWAYFSTETGIMPEVFAAIPPGTDPDNKWDKARWLEGINAMHPPGHPDEVKDADARAEKIASSLRIPKGMSAVLDGRYILRPEAIESLFVMYRITGAKHYQEVAWKMFENIIAATQTELSYASIPDVTQRSGIRADASESFWMAETLKYFYLIFSEPDLVSLDDYVFTTEAHPLKIPKPL